MTGMGKDMVEIASLLIGVALVGLLVVHAQGTATVATGISKAFSGALATATFQNGYANPFAGSL
jgi:hypothetical protein